MFLFQQYGVYEFGALVMICCVFTVNIKVTHMMSSIFISVELYTNTTDGDFLLCGTYT